MALTGAASIWKFGPGPRVVKLGDKKSTWDLGHFIASVWQSQHGCLAPIPKDPSANTYTCRVRLSKASQIAQTPRSAAEGKTTPARRCTG